MKKTALAEIMGGVMEKCWSTKNDLLEYTVDILRKSTIRCKWLFRANCTFALVE